MDSASGAFSTVLGPHPDTLNRICSCFPGELFQRDIRIFRGVEKKWKNPRQTNFALLLFISCVYPETHLGGFIAASLLTVKHTNENRPWTRKLTIRTTRIKDQARRHAKKKREREREALLRYMFKTKFVYYVTQCYIITAKQMLKVNK